MKNTPENKVKKKLDAWAKDLQFRWWQALSSRYHSGLPDRVGIYCGKFHAYECKAPGKKLTKIQEVMLKRIARAGGEAHIVTIDENGELEIEKITA